MEKRRGWAFLSGKGQRERDEKWVGVGGGVDEEKRDWKLGKDREKERRGRGGGGGQTKRRETGNWERTERKR